VLFLVGVFGDLQGAVEMIVNTLRGFLCCSVLMVSISCVCVLV